MSVVQYRRRCRQIALEYSGRSYETRTIHLFPVALLSSAGQTLGWGVSLLSPEPTELEPVMTSRALPEGSAQPPQDWTTFQERSGSSTGHGLVVDIRGVISRLQSFEKSYRPGETAPKRLCARDPIDQPEASYEVIENPDGKDLPFKERIRGIVSEPKEPIRSEPSNASTSRGEDEGVSSAHLASVEDLGFTKAGPTHSIFNQFKTPPSDEEMLRHGLPLLLGFSLDRETVAELIGAGQNIAEFFASKLAADIRELQRDHRKSAKVLAWEGDGGLALMRVLHWILRTWGSSHGRQEIRRLITRNLREHLRLIVVDTETDLPRLTGSSGGRNSLPFRLEAGGVEIDLKNIPCRVTTGRRISKLALVAVEGKSVLFLAVRTPELPKNEALEGYQNELFSKVEEAQPLITSMKLEHPFRAFNFFDPSAVTSRSALTNPKGIFDEILQPQSLKTGRPIEPLPFYVKIQPGGNLEATFNDASARTLCAQKNDRIAPWEEEDYVHVDELRVDEPKYKLLRDNCQIQYDTGVGLNVGVDRRWTQFDGRLLVKTSVNGTPIKTSVRFVSEEFLSSFAARILKLRSAATVYEPSGGQWVIGFRQPEQMLKTTKLADSKKELLRVPSDWRTRTSDPPILSISLKDKKDKTMYEKAKAMEEFLPKLTGLPFAAILRTLKNAELRKIAAIHWPFDLLDDDDSAPVDPVDKVEPITGFETFSAFDEALKKLHELFSKSQSPKTWNTQIYSFIDSYCKRSLNLTLDREGWEVIKFGGSHETAASRFIAMRVRKGCLHGILAFNGPASTLLLNSKSEPLFNGLNQSEWTKTPVFNEKFGELSNWIPRLNVPVGLSMLTSGGLYTLRGGRWEERPLEDVTETSMDEEDSASESAISDHST